MSFVCFYFCFDKNVSCAFIIKELEHLKQTNKQTNKKTKNN